MHYDTQNAVNMTLVIATITINLKFIAMALQWHCNGRHNCGPDCQVCIITRIEIMIGAIVMGAEMTIAMDIEMAILILI
jgi:hypothetical protein